MDEIKKFEMNSPYRKSLFKITKKHKPFLENQIKVTQATNVKQAQEENLDIS